MLCIISPTTDPVFNLAAEEYLFKNFGDDVFFLYINAPSVVVGKHQNAIAEVNPVFVFENDIKVIRRMSGGGAVYHDYGNLNFSFHKTVEDTAKVSFSDFTVPVVELLNQLGVQAVISKRNDILVNGLKVSGHAQHVFRNRVLSHGTLLIESDLTKLSDSLRKGSGIYESKAIQSVLSSVANVSGYLLSPLSAANFSDMLSQHILNTIQNAEEYQLSDSDLILVRELIENKYSTWNWNFGYSPSYRFKNAFTFPQGVLSCALMVEKGLISEMEIGGEALSVSEKEFICERLIKQPHHPDSLIKLSESNSFSPLSTHQFLKLFF